MTIGESGLAVLYVFGALAVMFAVVFVFEGLLNGVEWLLKRTCRWLRPRVVWCLEWLIVKTYRCIRPKYAAFHDWLSGLLNDEDGKW